MLLIAIEVNCSCQLVAFEQFIHKGSTQFGKEKVLINNYSPLS